MNAATQGMVEARNAIERALIGPTSGGTARLLAPVVLSAIVSGQIPGVTFTPGTGEKARKPPMRKPNKAIRDDNTANAVETLAMGGVQR